LVTVLLWLGGALLLLDLVVVPVGLGAATTGAGGDVVVGADECVVVTAGADVVVTGAECVVVGAGVADLCVGALLCWEAGFFFVVVVVVVVEAVCVCGGVDAAGVELVREADVPPQPATASAAATMLGSALFMDPLPFSLDDLQSQGTRHPGCRNVAAAAVKASTDPLRGISRPSVAGTVAGALRLSK
jgi:hypothetical protein